VQTKVFDFTNSIEKNDIIFYLNQMIRKSIILYTFIFSLLTLTSAQAREIPSKKWGVGPNLGIGYENKGDNDIYVHFGASISYRFNIPLSIRLSGGGFYLNTPDYSNFHDFVNLSGIYHVLEYNKILNPYIQIGTSFMFNSIDLDINAGIGNTFKLKDNLHVFSEVSFGSNLSTRDHARLSSGLMFKF
jgi:hypothetical protein